jgi:NAD(P)-dependent dehydrogenase (short-subunit alcohol dehydrogenase family)
MEMELTHFLGRKPYERKEEEDPNHRNGSYDRSFTLKGVGPVEGTFGKVDVLANVAGIVAQKRSPIEDVTEEDWDRVMAVNLKGTLLCSQVVGKEMIKQGTGGSIVNIASNVARFPQIYGGAYSPSKAGVVLLTQIMAVEWAKHHIRVSTISPGVTATEMIMSVYNTQELVAKRVKSIPMNRFAQPEEMAKGAVFLASDESNYVTGHNLVIDGGFESGHFYMIGLLSSS